MERCEWNPVKNVPTTDPPADGDCANEATVGAGTRNDNNWHLCERCAQLPRFARFKKRPLRAASKENAR